MARSVLTAVFLIIFTSGYSQVSSLKNAVFVELIGNAGLYSINYEYQSLNKTVARLGFSVQPEAISIPITIGKLIGPSKDLFELGIGTTIFTYNASGDDNHGTALFLTGTIGYRYQKPDGRFLFRIGFTPLINIYEQDGEDFQSFIPLGGMSFGFRF